MPRMSFEVRTKGEKVLIVSEDGTAFDFSPANAIQLACSLMARSFEANGMEVPDIVQMNMRP